MKSRFLIGAHQAIPGQFRSSFGWVVPGQLAVLASSPESNRSLGNATILSGIIPDFVPLNQPGLYSLSFVLKGLSRIEVKNAGRTTEHLVQPGGFSITQGWGGNAVRNPLHLDTLNIGISLDRLTSIVENEFARSASGLELHEGYQITQRELVALGQAFTTLIRSPRPGGGLYAESLWTQMALQLLWNHSSLPRHAESECKKLSDYRVQRVVDYFESSYGEEASLKDLAAIVGLTPIYFLKAFKKATGKTPHRYLRDLRMEKARELLADPHLSILSVAIAVGYTSQSHFTHVFRKEMGITPARYRIEILCLDC